MARRVLLTPLMVALLLGVTWAASMPALVSAAVPSDKLLPATTKGYLSIPDTEELSKKFHESQLGQLCDDPVMKPFADDLKRQLQGKFSEMGVKLGVSLDELQEVVAGELAVALVQPNNNAKDHALVVYVDVHGKETQAKELLAKIAANQEQKGAKKSSLAKGAIEITVYTLPKKRDQKEAAKAFYFLHADQLVAVNHEATVIELADRLQTQSTGTLSEVKAYEVVMAKAAEAGDMASPQVRWFVEPFGYAEASRASQGGRKKRGTDMIKVLANQGFKAIQGLGGYVSFSTGKYELLHRSFVYAPAAPDAEPGHKYTLAARMLNFPNAAERAPLSWVPDHLANHVTLQVKIKEGFEYVGSLVDEVAGEPGVFEEVLKSIAIDRNGPQVDLRKELVAFAGERITVVTDCRLPVTTKSERLLVGIEVTNPAMVARAINKIMESDPNAHKHELNGHTVWEIKNDENSVEVETLMIEGSEFVSTDEEEEDEEEKPVIPNSAVTVAHGHLIVASHIDFIEQVLHDKKTNLGDAEDYVAVGKALAELGAQEDAVRFFTRTNDAYRATYELIRQGKMPESETMMGKLLNRMLGPDDEDAPLREQEIDGSKMPEFSLVEKYLGAAGAYVRSQDDGWIIIGCLLKKEAK